MIEREKKIEKLKKYFEGREDVVIAFLFGSQAKKQSRKTSDWDIGIYLIEEDRAKEQEIWGGIEHITEEETDLVVLNRAPASIAWAIMRTGLPLVIKKRKVFLDFMLRVSDEAEAWKQTAREYHEVFQRSASLTEDDALHLQRSIEFLKEEARDYKKFQELTWKEYQSNRAKRREVERWSEQIMNAVIDISKIILSSEHIVIPETYRLMVQTVGTVPPFDRDLLCKNLSDWAGLRNVLAHDYLDYRWKELTLFIKETEPLIHTFINALESFLTKNYVPHS